MSSNLSPVTGLNEMFCKTELSSPLRVNDIPLTDTGPIGKPMTLITLIVMIGLSEDKVDVLYLEMTNGM